ncbi:pentapeptide repeat-containing protein [Streptomyces reniochalinae]|uniref:Pentapeptide repeat-containing protein n=1 Tax=Streptomyces reniochalinae TaxID=2250578 RepID=A0A367EG46_9ACTN|nr:pentapeptide repeat-containing protein [Streptomyces reniochalinae]RCG16933.1 pentapeptide repeat-containing protein [Streptomyces reniochalinae]
MTGRMKLLLGCVATVSGVALFALLFWRLPWWMDGAHLREKDLQPGDGVVITGVRTALVALGTAFIAGLGIFYTRNTLKHTRERDREQAELTREGQVTDRYVEAIKLLADEEATKCLGGIYALERIMKDSEKDHSTVVEVLAAFIRERSPSSGGSSNYTESDRPNAVVQAALNVLGRRPIRAEKNRINLRNVDLRGADLSDGYFVGLDFSESDLREADYSASHLHGVSFRGALIDGTCFIESLMDGCFLNDAKGSNTNFDSADLSRAWFSGCEFHQADFSGADLWASHWTDSSIHESNFERSDLRFSMIMNSTMGSSFFRSTKWAVARVAGSNYPDSDFQDSNLDWAIIVAGDLSETRGVEASLLQKAMISADVKLPEDLSKDACILRRIKAYDDLAGVPILGDERQVPQCCISDAALSHETGLMQSIPSEAERDSMVREAVKNWPIGIDISVSL